MKNKILLYCVMVLVPTLTTPAIWLRKDPQAIIDKQDSFFFPFLKEENVAIIRNYPAWAQEVLSNFADKIRNYPTSEAAKGKDPKIVEQAQAILKKEYQQLRTRLTGAPIKKIDQTSLRTCKNLSSQQREKLYHLLEQTRSQLFGEPLMKIMMIGIQGPKLEDFKRRAAIEDVYATATQELDGYAGCSKLSSEDKVSIKRAREHVQKLYNETLESEGLRTAEIMKNI